MVKSRVKKPARGGGLLGWFEGIIKLDFYIMLNSS